MSSDSYPALTGQRPPDAGPSDGAVMVEMGLRAAEVASIRLEDIDWRHSILRIHETKSGRERLLPLPRRPGCAIARYLHRWRPLTSERSLFVRHRKVPGFALTPGLVRRAMRRAYAPAGFPLEWCVARTFFLATLPPLGCFGAARPGRRSPMFWGIAR